MGYKGDVVESFKSDRCVGSPPFCANELSSRWTSSGSNRLASWLFGSLHALPEESLCYWLPVPRIRQVEVYMLYKADLPQMRTPDTMGVQHSSSRTVLHLCQASGSAPLRRSL